MDRRLSRNYNQNGHVDLDLEPDIISEETLAQLVPDDEQSWLSIDLISNNGNNRYHNGNGGVGINQLYTDDGGGKDVDDDDDGDKCASVKRHNNKTNVDCDINEWLSNDLENEAYKSTKDNLARELDNLAVLHKLESSSKLNKFGRMSMPERNLETRWESKLEYNKEIKLDTRTITKRKPTFFNRFSSSEELSPNNGNLRNTRLNYSSHNISGSNSNLNSHLSGSTNDLESTFIMRKTKHNSTFTMEDDERYDSCSSLNGRRDQQTLKQQHLQLQQQQQQREQHTQHYQQTTLPASRCLNGLLNRKTTDDHPVKKKPISMYSVYAEPTDSRPIRSTNTTVLSAYRAFKSSALNRQYEYKDEELIINNNRYSPDYSATIRKTSTPIANNTVSTARMIKRNGTFTCNKPTLPRYTGSFIPKPK